MSYIIKRTTEVRGIKATYYFMQMTLWGPMFQTVDLAKKFESKEAALEYMEEEDLFQLEGDYEIEEVV